jgi:hypothetical protein
MILIQSSPKLASNFSPKRSLPNEIKILFQCYPSTTKCSPNAQFLSSAAYSRRYTSHHLTFFTIERFSFYLTASLSVAKGQAGAAWEPAEQ